MSGRLVVDQFFPSIKVCLFDKAEFFGHFQHAYDGFASGFDHSWSHRDFWFFAIKASVELFEGVEFHIRAVVASAAFVVAQSDEYFVWVFFFHLVEDACFGSYDKFGGGRLLYEVEHSFGRANEVGHLEKCRVAFGMSDDWSVGVSEFEFENRFGLHSVVNGANSIPK